MGWIEVIASGVELTMVSADSPTQQRLTCSIAACAVFDSSSVTCFRVLALAQCYHVVIGWNGILIVASCVGSNTLSSRGAHCGDGSIDGQEQC